MKPLVCGAWALLMLLICCGCSDRSEAVPESGSASASLPALSASSQLTIGADGADPSEGANPSETGAAGTVLPDDAFYEAVLCAYGAEWHTDESGARYLQERVAAPYSWGPWTNAEAIPPAHFASWFRGYLDGQGVSGEAMAERYASPFGEGTGWFFPEAEFERTIQHYFAVDTDHLRSDPLVYSADEGGYRMLGGGVGDLAKITLDRVEAEGDLCHLHLSLSYFSFPDPVSRVLTIELRPDGSYRFVRYTAP